MFEKNFAGITMIKRECLYTQPLEWKGSTEPQGFGDLDPR
jgi:hypothetical protein